MPSLTQLIASGDENAIAEFRDAHTDQVQSYCTIACGTARAGDATEAAFVDFLGRVLGAPEEDDLEELLLVSTRSAAAPRFSVPESAPSTRPELCAAVPELLAARANGEISPNDHLLSSHVKHCERCEASAAQMERAEAAFREVVERILTEPAEPTPASSPPRPEPGPAPTPSAVTTVRRRSGGLVGKLARRGRSQA